MNTKINVLVTGAGGAPGQSIIKALRISSLNCRIIAVDANPMSAGIYRSDAGYLIPYANTDEYLNRIIEICKKENIDIILIGSTPEVPVLAEYKKEIEDECVTIVVVSDESIVDICYNKYNTYKFLKLNNLPYPETVDVRDYDVAKNFIEKMGYPLILKPQEGCAAKGVYKINSPEEFDFYSKTINSPIVLQEYLSPDDEEYTCGLFYDKQKRYQGSIIMKRELSCGGTYRGIVDDFKEIHNYIRKVGDALGPIGPINIQLRNTEKGPIVFEINPRFSCSDAMRVQMGYNAPEATIRHFLFDEEVSSCLKWKKGISMRYMNEVLITMEEYKKLKTYRYIDKPKSQIFTGF